jgi:hypothetical protein
MKLTKSESSRINGAKSRGPKTARGRAFSSQNAISHGLTARTLVLTNESRDEFEQMLNTYLDWLQPSNPVELDLVSDMVAARWRLRRIWSYQSALLDGCGYFTTTVQRPAGYSRSWSLMMWKAQ